MKIIFTLLGFILTMNLMGNEGDRVSNRQNEIKHQQQYDSLMELSDAYSDVSPQKSLEIAMQALSIARADNNPMQIAKSKTKISINLYYLSQYDESLQYGLEAKELYEKYDDYEGLSTINNNIGAVYRILGDYDKALELYLESLEMSEKYENKKDVAISLNSLGNLYYTILNYDLALDYFEKSLNVCKAISDTSCMSASLNNIGIVYDDMGQYERALLYYMKSLKIEEKLENKSGIAASYNNIGVVYKNLNHLDEALKYYLKAIKVSTELGDQHGAANTFHNIGDIYYEKNEFKKALLYFDKGLEISKKIGAINITERGYEGKANVLQGLKRYEEALDFLRLSAEIRDSLFSMEQARILTEAKMRFESEKKEKEIQYLKSKEKIHSYQILSFLIISLLFLIVFFLLLNGYRNKNINNQRLSEKNQMINEKNNELQKQYSFLQVLMDTIPHPIFYKNRDGIYLGINKSYEEYSERERSDIVGKNVFDIFPKELAEKFYLEDIDMLDNPRIITNELDITRLHSEDRFAIIKRAPFFEKNGDIAGIIGTVIDITNIKKAEESIRISEKKLREVNASKDRLFSIFSHDLKNALSIPNMIPDFLLSMWDELEKDEIKDHIVEFNESINHALKLLETLLEWARLQTGNIIYQPEKLDVLNIINECVLFFDNNLKQKNIHLQNSICEKSFVYADRNMLKTVFRNLLSNAVKFTHSEGLIDIYSTDNEKSYFIHIADSGVGIEEDVLDKLFKLDFHHSTMGTKNEKGSGLGLILCKEFIEKNGGTISASSNKGEGSIFTVCIPKVIDFPELICDVSDNI